MNFSEIKAISYYLPEATLDNSELASLYPGWSEEKIFEKTGITRRHIAGKNETACDMAEQAALKLFEEHSVDPDCIDYVLLATQSPDYFLPTTACVLQNKLKISKNAGALDFNLGCSAYVYGLSLAKGLITAGIAKNVLLITSETYTKHIHPMDKSVRTIFGDAATASLIVASDVRGIGDFVLRTDGSGFDKLIVPVGGMRRRQSEHRQIQDDSGNIRTDENIYMDGTAIFNFTLEVLPELLTDTLKKNSFRIDEIDLFVFHQANKFMLDALRRELLIPAEKFYVAMDDIGNTVSSSIPIALYRAQKDGALRPGMNVFLAGFGVGLSWGGVVVRWEGVERNVTPKLNHTVAESSSQEPKKGGSEYSLHQKLEMLQTIFEFDDVQLTPETLLSDLMWDSVAKMSFISLVQERFGRIISGSQMQQLSSIEDMLMVME